MKHSRRRSAFVGMCLTCDCDLWIPETTIAEKFGDNFHNPQAVSGLCRGTCRIAACGKAFLFPYKGRNL